MTTSQVLTIAHRGASAYAPENTLSSLRTAVELGCDLAEVDVQRTRDGVLVLAHDAELGRTTGRNRRISDVTYRDLQRLDAGSWFSPVYAGERIPTLEQALDVLGGTGTGLLLEVKHPARYPGITADVARALHDHEGRVVVQSFDHDVMRDFARLGTGRRVGLLGHPPVRRLRALSRWAAYVNPRHRRATAEYVDAVHDAGMSSFVWTVDRDPDIRRALDLRVDGVISNRPDAVTRALADRLVPAL
ncbi:glycerophosphodiester phosphodiesterase [Nocardioides euryhalodurans]|uniref:glycerophosphodiester phosphodiesterase n=1 Tax=Nocardioides euryhalodurans TaxID=2518370 RepID=UPI00141E3543|nr:glycerophosphodiester phosphodiesterase family protein [Nocardioides euryhalodurans]